VCGSQRRQCCACVTGMEPSTVYFFVALNGPVSAVPCRPRVFKAGPTWGCPPPEFAIKADSDNSSISVLDRVVRETLIYGQPAAALASVCHMFSSVPRCGSSDFIITAWVTRVGGRFFLSL